MDGVPTSLRHTKSRRPEYCWIPRPSEARSMDLPVIEWPPTGTSPSRIDRRPKDGSGRILLKNSVCNRAGAILELSTFRIALGSTIVSWGRVSVPLKTRRNGHQRSFSTESPSRCPRSASTSSPCTSRKYGICRIAPGTSRLTALTSVITGFWNMNRGMVATNYDRCHPGANKQKGQSEDWPKCLNLLVGAAGFELATPCTP